MRGILHKYGVLISDLPKTFIFHDNIEGVKEFINEDRFLPEISSNSQENSNIFFSH